jgi:predicted anti-sigma-YlaC factor YlaD
MIPCRKASELMSQGLDEPLTWWQKFLLAVHFLHCAACRRFSDHLQVLRAAHRSSLATGEDTLSPEAREKIRAALAERELK